MKNKQKTRLMKGKRPEGTFVLPIDSSLGRNPGFLSPRREKREEERGERREERGERRGERREERGERREKATLAVLSQSSVFIILTFRATLTVLLTKVLCS